MHFCHLRKLHPDPTITVNKVKIPLVEKFKFLGIIFDKRLTFTPHIKTLRTKCVKALNLLKVVSCTDWGVDSEALLRLC